MAHGAAVAGASRGKDSIDQSAERTDGVIARTPGFSDDIDRNGSKASESYGEVEVVIDASDLRAQVIGKFGVVHTGYLDRTYMREIYGAVAVHCGFVINVNLAPAADD
jgi:hypothetical protein